MKKLIVPRKFVSLLPPSVGGCFKEWAQFMYNSVQFNMPDSPIHATSHCERVLLYALLVGAKILGQEDKGLISLEHAAVFHDTRRVNDGKDTGHGARAAAYYTEFCEGRDDMTYCPIAACLMKYHDINDADGEAAIAQEFPDCAERVTLLYRIFKDADALDRWRLGRWGLDPRYLRTPEADGLTGFSRKLVEVTTLEDW